MSGALDKDGTATAGARPTALYAVSEYGEFFSLLEVAKRVEAELGLHPVFLFTAGYGALNAHSQVLERLNYSWTTAQSWLQQFDARGVRPGVSDYVPSRLVGTKIDLEAAASIGTNAPEPGMVSGKLSALAATVAESLYFLTRLRGRFDQKGDEAGFSRMPFFRLSRFYGSKLQLVARIVNQFAPRVIIAGQDYPLSIATLAAHAGKARRIPMAVIPFSMTPTTKEVAESFFGSRTNEIHSPRVLAFARRRLPAWLHVYRGRIYSRLSLPEAIASERLGLTPPEPWTPNSGQGVVMAPSRQGLDYLTSAGITPDKRQLTGALWSDRLLAQAGTRSERRDALIRDVLVFETYARNVARSRTVPRRPDPIRIEPADSSRKVLVFSWPPNQRPRKPFGFADADQLNVALAEMLIALAMSASVKVAVSLHPTLVGTPLAGELKRAGLYVIDKPLIEVVDCADIFCATVSSTLLWALQAGVPSVNLDIYGYGYREFTDAGMAEASTLPALRAELLRLVEDDAHRAMVAERQAAQREYWTMPDGRAGERLIAALRGMMLSP
jgi:hypothetical protein